MQPQTLLASQPASFFDLARSSRPLAIPAVAIATAVRGVMPGSR